MRAGDDPAAAAPEGRYVAAAEGAPALVVFAGTSTVRILRLLKRGFRHCFVVVWFGNTAIFYDPLFHQTRIDVSHGISRNEVGQVYRAAGFHVVETRVVTPSRRQWSLRPFTCVEAVKRVLGLTAPGVLTPWQLYRFLTMRGGGASTGSMRR